MYEGRRSLTKVLRELLWPLTPARPSMLLPLDLRSSGRSVRNATAIVPLLISLSTKRIGLPLRSLGAGLSAAPARGAAVAAVRARALTAARMREEEDMPPWSARRGLVSGPPRWLVASPGSVVRAAPRAQAE